MTSSSLVCYSTPLSVPLCLSVCLCHYVCVSEHAVSLARGRAVSTFISELTLCIYITCVLYIFASISLLALYSIYFFLFIVCACLWSPCKISTCLSYCTERFVQWSVVPCTPSWNGRWTNHQSKCHLRMLVCLINNNNNNNNNNSLS